MSLGIRPDPTRLPSPPYTLRFAGLRVHWPGGEVLSLGEEFVLPRGHRLALVRTDRVRASALAAVLLGFIDYEGTATLNDVQLSDLAGRDLRRVVALCAPDAPLMPATVADNVRLSRPDATDDQVAGALRRAGVDHPPEARIQATGHERQRIALARALIADAAILIVEEPAPRHEEDTGDVLAAAGDRTVLFVTSRTAVPGAAAMLERFDEVRALGR